MATAEPHALDIQTIEISALQPDPSNPRIISAGELEALTRSIQEFGLVDPIIARLEDSTVIGGHQRLVAARRLGLETVPVIFLDLPPEQARVLGLALNKISGEWDRELLARLLADLETVPEIDLTISGFDDGEIATLLKTLDAREKRERVEAFDLDAALEEARRAHGTKRGECWALGEHRLLCGDATDAGDVARLLDGKRGAMCFTDPPYNVAIGDHGGQQAGARRRPLENDALAPEEWEAFCRAWAGQLLANVEGALYICMSSREWPMVSRILAEQGGHWSDTIIWAKDRFVLGRADYQRQYEPIWYGWREGASHDWSGGRGQGDVWSIPRPTDSPLHPTTKPLALVERAIENSSRSGDLVLDLFLGSGTTVIAAERTGRVCYAMELDPHYAQVAVLRWQAFTGEWAKKVE